MAAICRDLHTYRDRVSGLGSQGTGCGVQGVRVHGVGCVSQGRHARRVQGSQDRACSQTDTLRRGSCLRLSPRAAAAILAAQAASSASAPLVEVLAKPLSFCAPLIRGICALQRLLQLVRGNERDSDMMEREAERQAVRAGRVRGGRGIEAETEILRQNFGSDEDTDLWLGGGEEEAAREATLVVVCLEGGAG